MSFTPITIWLRNLALSALLNNDRRTDAICTRQDNAWKRKKFLIVGLEKHPPDYLKTGFLQLNMHGSSSELWDSQFMKLVLCLHEGYLQFFFKGDNYDLLLYKLIPTKKLRKGSNHTGQNMFLESKFFPFIKTLNQGWQNIFDSCFPWTPTVL